MWKGFDFFGGRKSFFALVIIVLTYIMVWTKTPLTEQHVEILKTVIQWFFIGNAGIGIASGIATAMGKNGQVANGK